MKRGDAMNTGKTIKGRRLSLGYTLEELATRVGTSRQTIHRYETGEISNIPPEKIEAIAKALDTTPSHLMGWDTETRSKKANARGIVPIIGEIACGVPIYADENVESYVCADGVEADFCLRAHGDSMAGARIYDGDLVFVKSQSTVKNGEIAVVVIGDEATLKRVYYYPEDNRLILCPENTKYAPMSFSGAQLETINILGKAVAFQSVLQ